MLTKLLTVICKNTKLYLKIGNYYDHITYGCKMAYLTLK